MGSANTKAVRERIRSVEGTRHITRAMQLVASSKIKRAQLALARGRDYVAEIGRAVSDLAAVGGDSPFLREGEGDRRLIVLIAGDRGLAGGYNANVLKAAAAETEAGDAVFFPVGRRACDACRNRDWPTAGLFFENVEKVTVADCEAAARAVAERYARGEWRSVSVIYTRYRNVLTQQQTEVRLLPPQLGETGTAAAAADVEYEPSPEAVLSAVIPLYLSGLLWGCIRDSYASEVAARQNAMDSATKNAGEMIDRLTLAYNRARQSAITGEITEIVAGSETR